MSLEPKRTEDGPHDRLTRICDAMTKAMYAHPEFQETDRGIVFMNDEGRGGLQLYGYDSDLDAVVDLFIHMKAIFEANGKTLMFAPIGEG